MWWIEASGDTRKQTDSLLVCVSGREKVGEGGASERSSTSVNPSGADAWRRPDSDTLMLLEKQHNTSFPRVLSWKMSHARRTITGAVHSLMKSPVLSAVTV